MFLGLETEDVQANIAGLTIFKGPAPTPDELKTKLASRLDGSPRFRQRLEFAPLRLTSPLWVDDENFDVGDHVSHEWLPDSLTDDQLRQVFVDYVSTHFDREHPLWHVRLYDNLPGGRWALGLKVHHAMVDGIAATELFALLLDHSPDQAVSTPDPWTPKSAPPRHSVVAGALRGPSGNVRPLRDLRRAFAEPRRVARLGREAVRALAPLGKSIISASQTPLNGPIGPRRRWANAQADLAEIKRIGRGLDSTVNDVVLAAVAGGIRELLIARGEQLEDFDARTMVPVSIRVKEGPDKWRNQVSAVFIELPVCEADPVERLRIVREQMDRAKQEREQEMARMLFELANYVPAPVWRLGEQIAWRVADPRRLMNTITTNVPGPQSTLYCLGREMVAIYPFVMLAKNIRVATAIISYDGGVYFGVTGDFGTVPDVDLITDGIEASIDELRAIATARGAIAFGGVSASETDAAKLAKAPTKARRRKQASVNRTKAGTAKTKSVVSAKGR